MIEKDTARAEYEKGGYTYQKVADKFNISINTVKSWAKRDKDEGNPWTKGSGKKVATKTKRLQPKERIATERKSDKVPSDSIDKEIVDKLMVNENLTDKQRLFCIHYIKCFNASKAALKAGYSKDCYGEIGYQLLQKTSIKEEIQKLKQHKLNRTLLAEDDIFQKYMDIAFADITDYTVFGQKEIEADMGAMTVSYIDFKESTEVDGTVISEISKGRDGIKVKLADKMKALQWLTDRMDLLPTEAQAKLELEKSKASMGTDEFTVIIKGESDLEE